MYIGEYRAMVEFRGKPTEVEFDMHTDGETDQFGDYLFVGLDLSEYFDLEITDSEDDVIRERALAKFQAGEARDVTEPGKLCDRHRAQYQAWKRRFPSA